MNLKIYKGTKIDEERVLPMFLTFFYKGNEEARKCRKALAWGNILLKKVTRTAKGKPIQCPSSQFDFRDFVYKKRTVSIHVVLLKTSEWQFN